MDQFDTFEILETKLINDLKIKDQINSLPKKKKTNIYILLLAFLLFIYLFLFGCKSYLEQRKMKLMKKIISVKKN